MEEDKLVVEERSSAQMLEAIKVVHATASSLADQIITLSGKNPGQGRVLYCAQLAIQKLEEAMHRANEMVQFLLQTAPDIREKVAEDALRGSGEFTVVNGGKK